MHSFKILVNGWSKQTYTRMCAMMIADTACALPLPTGVNHDIPVLRDILTQPKFIAGDINTNFIKEVYHKGFKGQWVEPHSWFFISKVYVLFLQIVCCPMRRGMS